MNQPTFCPYLGTKFDRNTKWGYASHLATCYLSEKEPFAPSLSHQQRFCLTERYGQCFRLTGQPTVVAPLYDSPLSGTRPRAGASPMAVPSPEPAQPQMFQQPGGDYIAPMRANDPMGQAPRVGVPYASATPNPAPAQAPGRPMTGRYSPRPLTDPPGSPVRPGPAAVLQGVSDTLKGLGRLGLAAIGAVGLLVIAFIFLLSVFTSGGNNANAARTPTVAAPKAGTTTTAPVLPSPGPATQPTQPAGAVVTPAAKTSPTAAAGRTVTVNAENGLNLRPEPSATGTPLARIPNGTQLEVLNTRQAADGTWLQVRFNNQTGWISAEFTR